MPALTKRNVDTADAITLDGCVPLDVIGAALGLSRERVRQIEQSGLRKMRCALAIERLVGRPRAVPIWRSLRGAPLDRFVRALLAAKEGRAPLWPDKHATNAH